ncbi:MAG TPA: argininosuccinate synthase, partial [Chiayiivirga sp.]|nr:argininosuccinate synthase [Chiayiivirga sp.]
MPHHPDSSGPLSPVPGPGSSPDIVLAFSGGLDTSFCVPWLQERG